MQRALRLFLSAILLTLIFTSNIYASTAGNTGMTGLWEYPTAEIPDDGSGRFGYTKNSPYNYYFLDMSWLPWLEINSRLTTFDTITINPYSSGPSGEVLGRKYMDKAIDLKAVLWHNRASNKKLWYLPSIAFGIYDVTGTEIMKAHYGVATWRWDKVALTLGYGSDRLNGFFGGIEYDVTNWLTIKAEYGKLDYTRDAANGFNILNESPKKKYNVGLVLKTPFGLEGSVSWQRGDEFAFTISQKINLRGPYIGGRRKTNYETPGDPRPANWEDIDSQELISRIKSGLEKFTRVRDVDITLLELDHGHKLILAYENYGYASHAEAMTRVLVVLAAVMPETEELLLIAKNAGVPIVQAEFPGTILFDIRARSIRSDESLKAALFNWAEGNPNHDANILKSKAKHEIKAMITYDPRIDQTIARTYMDRWNIDLIYKGRYSNGWQSVIDVKFPFANNIDTSDWPGLWWEKDLNDKIRIQQAGFTYARNIFNNRTWIFGEAGYLDEEWFGANFWGRVYAKNGSWWLGARFAAIHDRDPYSFGGLTDGVYVYYRGSTYDVDIDKSWRGLYWAQAGIHISPLDLDIQADWGKFADGDKGWKISATRHWDDTAIGFWYMDTDVHAPGKSYTKAGVHLEIPADKWFGTWFGNSSAHVWEQDTLLISAWDIQSGREGGKIRTPERFMDQLRPVALKLNVQNLLQEYCSYDDGDNSGDTQEIRSILDYVIHK
ncbi:MAG: YjbH domain-containing protein [Synergistaceae bacterium]|nr:YjbH domain-containing protein [Synergistaceae bacterium]